MRTFHYSLIKDQKRDPELLGYIAAIDKEAGKQELYLKQRPEELGKLAEIAKIQSTEASNAIEGIVTTSMVSFLLVRDYDLLFMIPDPLKQFIILHAAICN